MPLERVASINWVVKGTVGYKDYAPSLNTKFPWKVIPEISYMNKKIASEDVFKAIGVLMRPTFCFYNHIQDQKLADRLVGLVFLPYSSEFIAGASE